VPHSALGLLAFGFVLGLRHALDVDHLAAVSTIVTSRRSLWASSIVGAVWGLGHTAALLAVALVVVGLHAQIPPRLGAGLELAVAAMLVGLGLNLLDVRHMPIYKALTDHLPLQHSLAKIGQLRRSGAPLTPTSNRSQRVLYEVLTDPPLPDVAQR